MTVHETSSWRLTRLDVGGAFGDIGVLFPIAIALISLNHMNPTAVFLTAGLTYILAGAYFGIPLAVQPFKAVAAIALAMRLTPSSIASSGLLMGLLLAFLGLTNLATWLAKFFSVPVVRGIQLGLGLLLAREGFRMVATRDYGPIRAAGFELPGWALALGGAVVLLAFQHSRRYPAALVLLGAGVALGLLVGGKGWTTLGWGPMPLELLRPRTAEFQRVLMVLVLPQFALTFGNSIVATENTARVLYGPTAERVTARALSLSIGFTNLASGMLLSAPTCHGSGGVTAHYKFGARTPKSSYVMGGVCLLLALFGRSAVELLRLIPTAVLGLFLIYVGIQHGTLIRDIVHRAGAIFVALCVGLVSLASSNLTWGFLVGFLLEALIFSVKKARANRSGTAETLGVDGVRAAR